MDVPPTTRVPPLRFSRALPWLFPGFLPLTIVKIVESCDVELQNYNACRIFHPQCEALQHAEPEVSIGVLLHESHQRFHSGHQIHRVPAERYEHSEVRSDLSR